MPNCARVKSRLTADRKPRNSITIEIKFAGSLGYIGLKDLKGRHFRPYNDKLKGELKDEVVWAKGENSDPLLLQAQQVRNYLFIVKMGKGRKRLLLAACVGLSFPDIRDQRTMTNKGSKRNVLHLLQAQQAPVSVCLLTRSRKFYKFKRQPF